MLRKIIILGCFLLGSVPLILSAEGVAWEEKSIEELRQHAFPGGKPRTVTREEIAENPYEQDVTSPQCQTPETTFAGRGYVPRDVPGTRRQIWFKDLFLGEGREVQENSDVVLRYWDDWRARPNDQSFWSERHPVRPEYRLQFRMGDKNIGKGIQTAILGMKENGRREAFIRLDLAEGLTTDQFKGAFVEVEILEIQE